MPVSVPVVVPVLLAVIPPPVTASSNWSPGLLLPTMSLSAVIVLGEAHEARSTLWPLGERSLKLATVPVLGFTRKMRVPLAG